MYFELERTGRILKDLKGQIQRCRQLVEPVFWAEGKARPAQWQEFAQYQLWGGYDKWGWFRMTVTIPADFDGFPVGFEVQTGRGPEQWDALNPQFLAYVNGEIVQGLDVNHAGFLLTPRAAAGEVYEIELAAYSGTANPRSSYDCSNDKQMPPRLELIPVIYLHDRETERLYYNLKAAADAAALYGEGEKLRIDIQNYLTTAVNMLDMREPDSPEYAESVQWANEYLETEFYGGYCGRTDAVANCIGHTHIDVAWMWTLEQTEQKAVRSFSTVLNLMKEYPDYLFMSSQPQLYQYVKKNAPEVYEQIKARVKEGRWEPEGAMWLEADCNLSSGESLVRQILYGKQFFLDEFGVESRVLWLPDVFGYSAALPQILSKSGIDSFVTSKISWNEYNHMPFDTFSWQGIDGTELFTQFINMGAMELPGTWFSTYNGQMHPQPLKGGWDMYQQKQINNETLVSFGFGDGGGGPTREMLEMYRRLEKGIPGVPKARMSSVTDTLDRIRRNAEESGRLPKWVGELYLEYHRGTYTSMARNKNYNRRCEFLLQTAEAVSVTANQLLALPYPKESLHACWETILLVS